MLLPNQNNNSSEQEILKSTNVERGQLLGVRGLVTALVQGGVEDKPPEIKRLAVPKR
jgi:hypothetical protein